jgi:hypothetical protein
MDRAPQAIWQCVLTSSERYKIPLEWEISLYLGNTDTVHMPSTQCCQLSGKVEKCCYALSEMYFITWKKKEQDRDL